MHARPLSADLPPEALAVLAGARAHETLFEGRRTVWHAWGPAGGEPVVLLHGGSGSWAHWVRNIEALAAAGREAWIPDLPGFGDSDLPATGGDSDALAPPVAAGIRQLLQGRAFDLVAFSMGGLVAGLVAETAPPGLRRLVVVGTPLLPPGPSPVRLLEWRHLQDDAERARIHRHNLGALMLHAPEAITPLAEGIHGANLARDRLRKRRLAQSGALAGVLQRVRCPVHMIYGREDALFRARLPELEATFAAVPTLASQCFLEGAGHWVQFEAPAAFDQALARALADPAGLR
ncbi:alpha/beta fold hydrolase [Ramlibacter sp. MAHUQ-53]|uniref:alpha/beta fold hydrolase n=1 Tax=unclassified Ramlibacter TaxID=2617605 RepID=UPI003627A5DE